MRHAVATLEGALLDAAVAKAEGRELVDVAGQRAAVSFEGAIARTLLAWAPSTNWSHGGRIIERERISVMRIGDAWEATVNCWAVDVHMIAGEGDGVGPTPLIAAMRAYVASKLGDEVEELP